MSNNLSNNLKKIRKEHNLSQEQLADELGVSRQAISKWESGSAYPEMEKILQICKKFDLNINDLLNSNINEVKSEQESKKNLNKYIDDFLAYITKTIKMFTSFNFKTKIKCISEQIIIFLLLLTIFSILGLTFYYLLNNLLSFIPFHTRNVILSILTNIYYILAIIFGFIIFFHVFKTRYLDYYEIIEEEHPATSKEEEKVSPQITLPEKQQIIIRDPKHSEYRFINGLMNVFLVCLKIFSLFFIFGAALTLLTLVIVLICSFLIIKTGIFFLGVALSLLGAISINFVILLLLLNFTFNRKNHKTKLIYTSIISVFVIGVGIGLICIGILDFKVIKLNEQEFIKSDTINLPMHKNLVINDYYEVEYIEKDIDDVEIEYKINKYFNLNYHLSNNYKYLVFNAWGEINNPFEIIKDSLNYLNNKQVVSMSNEIMQIKVYASKENIQQIKDNTFNYIGYSKKIDEYENTINQYQEKNYELEMKIEELQNTIYEYQKIINNYENDNQMS